jgi:hypothetical protein
MAQANLGAYDDAASETIALLQGEVERLEAEIRACNEALRAGLAEQPAGRDGDGEEAGPLRRKVEELSAELAGRDETIAVLLEQTSRFEEAAVASRAEWDQLARWVEEVEQRVEGQGERDVRLGDDLDAERRRSAELSDRLEAERRSWDARRRALEGEADDLRRRLAAGQGGGSGQVEALEQENRRLRAECAARSEAAALAVEVGPLRERLAAAMAEVEGLRAELVCERDDRDREQKEHEAAVSSVRSRLMHEFADRQPDTRRPANDPDLEPDERIRAFRQHLCELHRREQEERSARSLSSRLSRLWRHTGPG